VEAAVPALSVVTVITSEVAELVATMPKKQLKLLQETPTGYVLAEAGRAVVLTHVVQAWDAKVLCKEVDCQIFV